MSETDTQSHIQSEEELPKSVRERIERNRKRALSIKQSKLVAHPYAKPDVVKIDKTTIKIGTTKYKDTGGGFLLEEPVESEPQEQEPPVQEEPPIFEPDRPNCNKCEKPFASSWLFDNFSYKCCDECKDTEEEHKLITKTEAVNTYLLKDCDLDKRDPPLRYITRKNPHNVRWGEMKLYLQLQVEERALQVWETPEKIEEEREKREEKRVLSKSRKYHKQLKELRMNMRSSLYNRTSGASHTHDFGPEKYNEETDEYTKKCLTCPYVETYEKM